MSVEPTARKAKFRRTVRRIGTGALVAVVLLVTATLVVGEMLQSSMRNSNPPPGELVDVGGHRMHINCTGEGRPTVVLSAGLDDFSIFWSLVQPEVAKFSRVCSFDRSGLGWSEPSADPRTIRNMVTEVHTLLLNAGVTGPFVMVGHSFGGAQVELYASEYPEDVVGVVLVDAAPADLFLRIPTWAGLIAQKVGLYRTLAALDSLGLLAFTPTSIPTRGLPDEAVAQYRAIASSTGYFRTAVAENEAFEDNLAEVRAAQVNLGSVPLVVISRGYWEAIPALSATDNDLAWKSWQEMQSELADLSADSLQIIATDSEHNVHLQQPQLVVDAIREVVEGTGD
ncbi:MAG TPA: alpha/beta hydrolase [Anaerolineales bacterium]|nr:alpha/beta hydrolase [Anaerolineales bacterium]